MSPPGIPLAVIGGSRCSAVEAETARRVGALLASAGCSLLCGGRGGVMQAAAAGARSKGALTVGILPGRGGADGAPNPHIDLPIYTGLGQARNQILVLSAAAVIGVGGGWGTLSEIALARKYGKPVVLLDSWRLPERGAAPEGLLHADSAEGAVRLALEAVAGPGEDR